MVIEVEFISEEFIKPSSPTPGHLRKFHFSFLDQLGSSMSVPYVLFYEKPNTISNNQRYHLLKQSLAKALAIFYPLAGRIDNHMYTDCNDEGALFIEAKANCRLSDILQNRDQPLNKLTPLEPQQGTNRLTSLFQITYFECGGMAVAFIISHMLGDGLSYFIFLNCWAAVARGDVASLENISIPPTGLSSIFPPQNVSGSDLMPQGFRGNTVTKSFVFDAPTLSGLRYEYSSKAGERLSRVTALSAFIMSRIRASVSRIKGNTNKQSLVAHMVNLRPLIVDPPALGNFIWASVALIDKEDACHEIGRKIHESIKLVNSETVKKIQHQPLDLLREISPEFTNGETRKYGFSSLCNFPVYEIDFGWGKPEWVTTTLMMLPNESIVIFFDTKEGRGIEACVTMEKEDMAEFEKDNELFFKKKKDNELLLLAHDGKQNFT